MAGAGQCETRIAMEIKEELETFFRLPTQKEKFIEILADQTEMKRHYSFLVDHTTLKDECPLAFEQLMEHPELFFEVADTVLKTVQIYYFEMRDQAVDNNMTTKIVHCRIFNYSERLGHVMKIFPGVEAIAKFAAYQGIVIRVRDKQIVEKSREYVCTSCKMSIFLPGKLNREYFYEKSHPSYSKCPNHCPNGRMKMAEGNFSTQDLFRLADHQEIVIQESEFNVSEFGAGQQPKTISVILEDNLVEGCYPGDQVTILGRMFVRIKDLRDKHKIPCDYTIYANNLEIENDVKMATVLTADKIEQFNRFWQRYRHDPFAARDIIVKSICPQIYEMYYVKLAVAVFFARGEHRVFMNKEQLRANSHMLIVGDPGLAKSTFLVLAKKLVPRSRYLVGLGATVAGLTISVLKKEGKWEIEGGAIPLCKGGVCSIDEFSTLSKDTQDSLHELMEQQTISIAKAQTHISLKTNVCIMGATNPPEKKLGREVGDSHLDDEYGAMYNYDYSNLGISTSLLGRFDIIIYLKDTQNFEWDMEMADVILLDGNRQQQNTNENLWTESDLQAYFLHIRSLDPRMTESAYSIIKRYYLKQRQNHEHARDDEIARRTMRLFNALMRVATNHARLRMSETVQIFDAVTAISIIDRSFKSPLVPSSSCSTTLHLKFPTNAKEAYGQIAFEILHTLEMQEVWEKENRYLTTIARSTTSTSSPDNRRREGDLLAAMETENDRNEDTEDNIDWNEIMRLLEEDDARDISGLW